MLVVVMRNAHQGPLRVGVLIYMLGARTIKRHSNMLMALSKFHVMYQKLSYEKRADRTSCNYFVKREATSSSPFLSCHCYTLRATESLTPVLDILNSREQHDSRLRVLVDSLAALHQTVSRADSNMMMGLENSHSAAKPSSRPQSTPPDLLRALLARLADSVLRSFAAAVAAVTGARVASCDCTTSTFLMPR